MCVEITMKYEAECQWCGKTHTEGSRNRSNEDFVASLKKEKWIVGKTSKRTFCSKSCKEAAKQAYINGLESELKRYKIGDEEACQNRAWLVSDRMRLEAEVATLKSCAQSDARRCLTCYYGAQASDLKPCNNCAKTYLMNWKEEGEQT